MRRNDGSLTKNDPNALNEVSDKRGPPARLRSASCAAAGCGHPDLLDKKLQIEIEIEIGIAIGIEEKWPAEMKESISIPIAISIPTNPRTLNNVVSDKRGPPARLRSASCAAAGRGAPGFIRKETCIRAISR